MDAFVANELATLKSATELETEELLRERERMLDEAGEAARAHLEETRTRAESILAEARRDGEAMRARFESELQADRERFEQSLADRDAQAQARVAELLADAERRRREAEELVVERQPRADAGARLPRARPREPRPRRRPPPRSPSSSRPYAEASTRPSPRDAHGDVFAPRRSATRDRYDSTNDAAA